MAWGLTALLLGFLVGWANPGSEDRIQLAKTGTLLATLLAFGAVMIAVAHESEPLLLGIDYAGGFATFLLLVILFLTGTWTGDALDRERRRRPPPPSP